MNDKSVKQVEKFYIVATIVILILLFLLKTSGSHLAKNRGRPVNANLAVGFAKEDTALQKESEKVILTPDKPTGYQNSETGAKLISLGQASGRNLQVHVQVSNIGDTTAADIRLDIPLLGNLDSPYQELIKEIFAPEPLQINDHSLGNRTATYHIASLEPAATETIILDYFLNVASLKTDLSSYEPAPLHSDENSPDHSYLLPAQKIESDHPEIIAKAGEIVDNLANSLDKTEAIFKFVIDYLQYNLCSPNRNNGAIAALRGGSGVCEDYAALFVALCRAEGIPARLVYGYTEIRDRWEIGDVASGKTLSLKGSRHCWAEFYLEGLGWFPADPTLNIYSSDLKYFASLPKAGHLAQNYHDQALRVSFRGGELDVTWEEGLAGIVAKKR